MNLPEPEPERAYPARAKREPHWLELCAEIAALSDLAEWEAFWPILEERAQLIPIGWVDIAHNEMILQRERILEALLR